ncbi:uncharacterized protein VICG_00941 [Vittaforma corneae ATCC 50505]|uniref:Uncharacterized protein n=1 Tax=Vittaforma corneae (strain ATCC 50505) TaxID=993615 RepID=L2GP69_VITCO|nr:uncharacterized protein VICG_00941 [Vittaforma corneae ATCC 50505]ELA42092.1 hypothetical protein VICG_00941 [Vittaforma corneae ATCC 50505]
MKIFLDSFVNICYLFALLIQAFLFVRNAIYSSCAPRSQRLSQFYLMFSLIFMVFYQLQLLRTLYNRKIIDFENVPATSKLKTLQYVGENTIHSVLCHSLAVILESFENFKMHSITDQRVMKLSAFIYAYIRYLPVMVMMSRLYRNTSFYSFLIEAFLISEDIVLILIFVNLIRLIKKIAKEIETCLMTDKTMVQYLLSVFKVLLSRLAVSLSLECLSKMLYLVVITRERSKALMFINDISNFLRVVSIYLVLENLTDMVFTDCRSFKVAFNEHEKDKFFEFEHAEKKNENIVE